jgi:hypothetical protein
MVPFAVAQRIILKFLTNENVKPAEILMRLRAQFDDETLLGIQGYNWSKSLKEGRTEVENMRRLHLLEGKLWPAFMGSSKRLIHRFLIEQRTTNAADYLKLLKDRVNPAFRSKRRSRSVKSICLLHDNARPPTAAVTTGTLEEIHWEVLPHPACSPELVPSNFHLFGPLKEALGGS